MVKRPSAKRRNVKKIRQTQDDLWAGVGHLPGANQSSHSLKPASKKYRSEILDEILKSRAGVEAMDIR
jgi:hypothetical protein